jgi:2',3'-cyclic-nucleotide 2'-phosphodiesterase (5'-nucleotidase family)
MLDSGDAIWAGNIFWRPGGEPELEIMNQVPYDAVCVGNREFHFREAGMKSKTGKAAFPFLSANFRAAKEGIELPVLPYKLFDCDGRKVSVFGLSVPCITGHMLVRRVSDFYFDPPVKSASELVPRLRDDADVVVALTHIGIAGDRHLAAEVEGIDLILGGHTHTVTEQPVRVGDTRIVHHGSHARLVGKVEVAFDSSRPSFNHEIISLAGSQE